MVSVFITFPLAIVISPVADRVVTVAATGVVAPIIILSILPVPELVFIA